MLQHVIDINARLFKVVQKRKRPATKVLLETTVDYSKLNQLTIYCKQQEVPEAYFEPASVNFLTYWDRFFPNFDLHEAYYEYNDADDFTLILYFRQGNRKAKGETRELKEKAPELFAICLREVDLAQSEVVEGELAERQERISELEHEAETFKLWAEEANKEKELDFDELEQKYLEAKLEKEELENETVNKEVKIAELLAELDNLKTTLASVEKELTHRKLSSSHRQKMKAERRTAKQPTEVVANQPETVPQSGPEIKLKLKTTKTDTGVRDIQEVTMSLDEPVTQVKKVDETQKKELEKKIKDLFQQSERPSGKRRTKIEKSQYRSYLTNIDFLDYQWSQAIKYKDSLPDPSFLNWCSQYMAHLSWFEDDLKIDVKKRLLRSRYYFTDQETELKLQAYDMLGLYLDTYGLENSQPELGEVAPFIHS